jgi:predicted site-specific integrase-resolvase
MESSLSIGDVAALYGLSPSTLRWWEKLGVVAAAARAGGRRVYDERPCGASDWHISAASSAGCHSPPRP